MRALAGVIVVGAVLSVGCITGESVERTRNERVANVLGRPAVTEATQAARGLGLQLAGILLALHGLFAAGSIYLGASSGGVGRQYVTTLLLTGFVLGTWESAVGVPALVMALGGGLGQTFRPPDNAWDQYLLLGSTTARYVLELFATLGSEGGAGPAAGGPSLGASMAAGVAHVFGSYFGGMFLAINGQFAYVMSVVMVAVHAWLMALYTIIGPLCAGCVAIPQTRAVFIGWLKAYIAIALWPALFGLIETIGTESVAAMVLTSPTPSGGAMALADVVMQNAGMALTINFIWLGAYLAVPVAAYQLVNGVGRPFRGIL